MARYYSPSDRVEVEYPGPDTIALGDGVIDWWFDALPEGYRVRYDAQGMPHKELIPPPLPIDPNEAEKERLKAEMGALLGGMTPAESMLLMLKYGFAKMQGSSDSSDAPFPSTPLTPTGEDLLVWGDRVAQGLESKLIELRKLK